MSHLRQLRQDLAPRWHYCSDRVTTGDVPICPSLLQTRPPQITQLECEITSEMGSGRRGPAPLGDGIARSDRRVTSQAAIWDALARLCLALSEQNVTFSLTSLPPSMSVGPLGRSAPQTLPITCSIRSAGLHSLCNRKNWRAYSTTPPSCAWGQFLHNFIHETGGEFTNWLLYLRIILLYEISK